MWHDDRYQCCFHLYVEQDLFFLNLRIFKSYQTVLCSLSCSWDVQRFISTRSTKWLHKRITFSRLLLPKWSFPKSATSSCSASRSSRLQAIYSDTPRGYIPVSMPLYEFVIFSRYMRWPQRRHSSSVWRSSVSAIRPTESAPLANYSKPALRLDLTCRAYGHLYGRQSDHVISEGPIFAQIHCNTSENKSAEGA